MKRLFTTFVVVLLAAGLAMAQRTITGVVTGEDGETLVGATIKVKDAPIGTRSDADGRYSLTVPAEYNTLEFSYTGFGTQEIILGPSNAVDVTMATGSVLSEAVVTALGITREEKSLGYGVTQVDGDDISRSGEVNAIQGLAAKSSGVQVIGSGGTPGASSKILIRGNKSFSGDNQPLMVVDGMPYDNQTSSTVAGDYPFNANLSGVNNSNRAIDLNSADIESINILKGPAAAALYGSRAANGVLIVTTKKGRRGINVDVGSSVGFDKVNKLPDLQQQYGQGSGGGAYNATTGEIKDAGNYVANFPQSWGPRIGTAGIPEVAQAYDNLDAYFETGLTWNNNIAVSMGNENTKLRLSYGNTDQEGIVPNTELKRNTFRLTSESTIGRFKLLGTAAYANTRDTKTQNGSNLSGVMLGLTRMPPSFNILGGEGPNGYDNPDGSSYTYFSIYDNPLWSAYNNTLTGDVDRITGNIMGSFAATSWLDFTARVGVDQYTDDRKQVYAIGANDPPAPVGEIWENTKRRLEVNTDIYGTLHPTLQGKFGVRFIGGVNLNSRRDDDNFSRGRNLAIPGFYNMSNASDLYTSQVTEERRIAGLYGNLNVSWDDQLFLELSGRNDWASTFGEDKRKSGFFYPSASLAWAFTEGLNLNDNVLSFGKIRASVAQAGREPAPYRTATYFNSPFITDGFTDGFGFPYGGQNGFGYSATLGNKSLEPEINTTYEIGTNLIFFKDRIDLDVNWYLNKNTNLLVFRPIAASTGYEQIYANFGEMENRGWEIELGLKPIVTKNFQWEIESNFTRNENEVTKLAPGVDEIDIEAAFASIGAYAIVGQPFGAFYGTQWDRNAEGQLLIKANGLPQVAATRGNLGNPYPDWTMGIRNIFSFYGFTINGLLDIREGGDLWNGTYARLNRFGTTQESADGRNQTYVIPGVKIADGTPNNIPISANSYFSNYVGDSGSAATEQAIQDGSWVRLRELTLGYDIPLPKNKYIYRANVYFTGRNLWLSTDYKGVDPETSLTGAGSNVGGFDYFNMPSTKSFIFGINLGF
jgi:TonB-linked SusC/RagA family outer membrane protein